jgi:hypothetical protein
MHFLSALAIAALFFCLEASACTTNTISGKDLRSGKWASIDPKQSSKGTVVLFLSAKCPCSQSHEAGLSQLSNDFPEMGFVAVQSNSDEDEALSALHFNQAELPFPVIRDNRAQIADDFRAFKTPHAFVVGPKGECWFDGGVDDSRDASKATKFYLRAALNDLREGREPQKKTARTLGCIIKR